MRSGYRTTQLQGITDLTVLADVKPGFVDGTFEVDTQAERLDRVLRVINGVRQASREAALQPNPFADLVGRFRSIHFFRFGIVTPDRIDGKHWKLLLNVTFDGGWEPYMRIIWKPLGTLLDLIYCHCKDYPLAYRSSYEDYIAWVRRHEIQSSFFYADSGITVADQQYLAALQAAQRDDGGLREGDACLASFALPGRPPAVVPTPGAASLAVRALKAVAGLRPLFADVTDQHGVQQSGLLLRFAHDFFADLRGWVADGLFDPGQPLDHLRPLFEDERAWLMKARDRPPQKNDRPALRPQGAQAGITASLPDKILHGAVVLLRVTDPAKVPAWLPSAATAADAPPPDAIYRNLAITYRGLRVLGVPPQRLERLPREFIDGMELRAGTMGDLRGNHPQWWKRPRRNWPTNLDPSLRLSLELSTVHLVVQLRTEAQAGDKMVDVDGCELVDRLHTAITALDGAQGVQVLHVQPMRRSGTGAAPRDHFGFADGISQPALHNGVASGSYWDDRVKTGELLLGYVNERGDGPEGAATPLDLLLDNGSYLVVRKLRQDKLLFEALVADQAQRMAGGNAGLVPALEEEVKSKLLGRRSDGTPLVQVRGAGANDFDYRHDTQGLQCPFQSHVRRANPREREPLMAMLAL
jgi:deferrochelatase/peroxidase EfeB